MSYGNDLVRSQAPNDYQRDQAMTPIPSKEVNVQERLGHSLNILSHCHEALDALENSLRTEKDPDGPPAGLIGSTIGIEESAGRLLKRISELRERLGTL